MYNSDIDTIDTDMAALESMLDEQNAMLDSLLDDNMDIAEEGLFSKPKSADQMVEQVKKSLNKKCKSKEDCDDLLAKLKAEESKFNEALKTMKDAAEKFKAGEIDKKAMKDLIKPAAKELKKTCNIISLKDVNEATDNVTDDEIKKLHDFLTGAEAAIKEKADSFGGDDMAQECGGSCESFLNSLDDNIATEGLKAGVNKAILAMQTKLYNWLFKLFRWATDKSRACKNPKAAQRWMKAAGKFKSWAQSIKGKADIRKEEMDKIKEAAEQEKADATAEAGENAATEATMSSEMDMEMAFEEYNMACGEYEIAQESAIAMEGAETLAAGAVVGGYIAAYAALIALCVKATNTPENKYLKKFQKELKPALKNAKNKIKTGKKTKNFDMAIAGCKEAIAINKKIDSEVDAITQEIKSSTYTKDSTGKKTEAITKDYSITAQQVKDRVRNEIQQLTMKIKLFEQDKKKFGSANESATEDSFVDGYAKALESIMSLEDDEETVDPVDALLD